MFGCLQPFRAVFGCHGNNDEINRKSRGNRKEQSYSARLGAACDFIENNEADENKHPAQKLIK